MPDLTEPIVTAEELPESAEPLVYGSIDPRDPSTWPAFWQSLPSNPGDLREQRILDEIAKRNEVGSLEVVWRWLVIEKGGDKLEIPVGTDSLKLDGIRINVTLESAIKLARMLGCIVPPIQLFDALCSQADYRLAPQTINDRDTMSLTWRTIDHSLRVDAEIARVAGTDYDSAICYPSGKAWALAIVMGILQGGNYHWPTLLGRLLQGFYTGHKYKHTDYSQVFYLILNQILVNGLSMPLLDFIESHPLAKLITGTGPLPGIKAFHEQFQSALPRSRQNTGQSERRKVVPWQCV